MDVINDLKRICQKQRAEIRVLKKKVTTGRENPVDFGELLNSFNKNK